MDAVIPRIYRLGIVTCLVVVVMLVACTGRGEPAAPATTVAVAATTKPANTLVPAPAATPVPTPQQGQADEPRDASPAPTDRRTVGVGSTCDGQRDALVAFYNATNGENWRGKDNWVSDHPVDTWFGVTADSEGCVYGLSLGDNQLSGEIPAELGNLTSLESLDLIVNQLSGKIPPELGALANLRELYLSGNQLTGEIPPKLGDLANLEVLYLHANQVSGCVPSSLQNQLVDADLGGLPFCRGSEAPTATPPPTQTLPEREALAALYQATDGPNWRNNTNWLSDAPLDEWHGVSHVVFDDSTDSTGSVVILSLNNNQLSGEIPPELGNLAFPQLLFLGGNQLTGEIPAELGNLAYLRKLELGENQLTGEIPAELGNLAYLRKLELGENQLTGEIPAELGNLAYLRKLELGENQLTGEIPPELGNLAKLIGLDLGGNQLSGCVPSNLQGQMDRVDTYLAGLPFCRSSEAPTATPLQRKPCPKEEC